MVSMRSGVSPASSSAARMQPMMGLPSGEERVRWKPSPSRRSRRARRGCARPWPWRGRSPPAPARRALAHDEAVAVLLNGLGRAFRRIVLRRSAESSEKRMSASACTEPSVPMHSAAAVSPGGSPRRRAGWPSRPKSSGGERDGRSAGAECVGDAVRHGAEEEELVPGPEAAGRGRGEHVAVGDIALPRLGGERHALRHSNSTGGTAMNSWPGNRRRADGGLGDRLLRREAGELVRQVRRAERFARLHGVDRAAMVVRSPAVGKRVMRWMPL